MSHHSNVFFNHSSAICDNSVIKRQRTAGWYIVLPLSSYEKEQIEDEKIELSGNDNTTDSANTSNREDLWFDNMRRHHPMSFMLRGVEMGLLKHMARMRQEG